MTSEADIRAALPDYEIGGELGRGGFGLVYSGRHRHLRRDVAIKELPPALAGDPEVRRRFAVEARILASLSHPHIVPIYDYVERDGLCLLVMELLPGGTVWSRFKEEGFALETTCALVVAVCAGLQYAHDRGVLHRDIKPENMLFSGDRVLKITDFGIAQVVSGEQTLATRHGEILGTPAYMAPEQAEGRELTARADVYATGVMLYELISGKLPFSDEGGALAIVYRHVYEEPAPLERVAPDVPPPLANVTMRALARLSEDRYPSAVTFGTALHDAAASVWGTDWRARAEVPVVDAGPISDGPRRPRDAPSGPGATPPAPRSTRRRERPPPPGSRPPPGDEPPSARDAPSPPRRSTVTRVRPDAAVHVAGAVASDVVDAELVPVRQVIELPRPPLVQALAALVLAIIMLAVAFIGVGSPERVMTIGTGTVSIVGADPAGTGGVEVDLAKPVEIVFRELPPQAEGANRVQLAFTVAGVPVPASTTEPLEPGAGARAVVQARSARWFVTGEVTGELRLLRDDQIVLRHQFRVRSTQSGFLTAPGVVAVAVVLFLLAYVESLLRPLRRGRRQVTGLIGMVVIGGALGAMLVPLAWLLRGPEPTLATAVVCTLLGAGAGAAAALAAVRIGRRRRIKPKLRAAAGAGPA